MENSKPQTLLHSLTCFKKQRIRFVWTRTFRLRTEGQADTSSAKVVLRAEMLAKSLMKIMKRRGERTAPCGTPARAGKGLEEWDPWVTEKVRSERKALIQPQA